MKLYFTKHSDAINYCNHPIKEEGAESFVFEVNEDDLVAVEEGSKDFVIVDGQLSIINSTRKADAEAAQASAEQRELDLKKEKDMLIEKLEKGEATQEEKDQLLIKLLKNQ